MDIEIARTLTTLLAGLTGAIFGLIVGWLIGKRSYARENANDLKIP